MRFLIHRLLLTKRVLPCFSRQMPYWVAMRGSLLQLFLPLDQHVAIFLWYLNLRILMGAAPADAVYHQRPSAGWGSPGIWTQYCPVRRWWYQPLLETRLALEQGIWLSLTRAACIKLMIVLSGYLMWEKFRSQWNKLSMHNVGVDHPKPGRPAL